MKCSECEDFDLCLCCYRSHAHRGHVARHRFHRRGTHTSVQRLAGLILDLAEQEVLIESLRLRVHSLEAAMPAEKLAAEAHAAEILSELPRFCWTPGDTHEEC